MSEQLDIFIKYIEKAQKELNVHRQGAFELDCNTLTLDNLDKVISLISKLEEKAKQGELKVNYLNQFQSNIESILTTLPFRGHPNSAFIAHQNEHWKMQIKNNLEQNSLNLSALYEQIEFNIDFFNKIGYFDSNVVAIGANGSGKTTLSNKFKTYLQNNGVVISAQRILLVPKFDSIANPEKTATDLKQYQLRDKTNKSDSGFNYLQQEFGIVLKNLLADNISVGNSFEKKHLNLSNLETQFLTQS